MTRLGREAGFTMPAVIVTMMIASLLGVGAWTLVVGDIASGRESQDHNTALHAARAGVEWFTFQLAKDPAVWSRCGASETGAPAPAWLRSRWNGTGVDPRVYRTMFGSPEKYTDELLPANGATACSAANPTGTMLQDGLLRIRATGRSRAEKRSLIATYKRRGFLDFLYFTNFETLDPVAYGGYGAGAQAWAQANCAKYWRAGRGTPTFSGNGMHCIEIQFPTGDAVNGPLHTNDGLLVCGSPIFGRAGDSIEMSAPSPGYRANSGCSLTPNVRGTRIAPAAVMDLPPSNTSLYDMSDPTYRFRGHTNIVLNGATMTVTDQTGTRTLGWPDNGVVYVSHNGCGTSYSLIQRYDAPAGCAEAWVHGTGSRSLTIGSEGDIVVDGNLMRANDAMLGLIANQFVRVYHPVINRSPDGFTCTNAGNSPTNITIQAAILALQHSFIVDNYYCGSPLGTLTILGAIAQRFRGPVGTGSGSSISTGYAKSYNYDDRLRFREPPNFLDPVQTSWRLLRATEQVPAP